MGKTRQSANLVSGGNIFSDIENDRVGIKSTIPAYDLDVSGDINLSGTLYQNGTEFTSGVGIQSAGIAIGVGVTQLNFIGAGNTFALNGTTVDISIAGGAGGGLSTTGFSTAYGLHIDPVGSGVTYSEDLVVAGNARVTGILSIGTSSIILDSSDNSIRLSSDTVIRRDNSTGDIRFLDNSDNLKKIIVNEITVGTGITINGTNNTINVGSGTTISSSGIIGNGANLTGLNASNITTGILSSARFDPNSNAYGTRTISSSQPSGGSNGDLWFVV